MSLVRVTVGLGGVMSVLREDCSLIVFLRYFSRATSHYAYGGALPTPRPGTRLPSSRRRGCLLARRPPAHLRRPGGGSEGRGGVRRLRADRDRPMVTLARGEVCDSLLSALPGG